MRIDDRAVGLLHEHVLGNGEGALIGVAMALDEMGVEAGLFHRFGDALAAPMHDDRAHPHRGEEAYVLHEAIERGGLIHDRAAHFHHDRLAVESSDVFVRFNQRCCFIDRFLHVRDPLQRSGVKVEGVPCSGAAITRCCALSDPLDF